MIEIHSKSDCPYCVLAKSYLTECGVPYEVFVYDDYDVRQTLYDQLDLVGSRRTVPQIFLVQSGIKEYIGGYNDLVKANITARLQMENFDADF